MKKPDINTVQSSRHNMNLKFAFGILGTFMALIAWVCFENNAPAHCAWSVFVMTTSWYAALAIRAKWTS
ncbi:MAG: hypothetical protein CBC85_006335 [Hyphomonadaceae bacterium TMED125]|nr:MAG: hypothetical protein CBC85_006335 [Hyphomonadaceae bacterium TMED125]